MQAFDFSAPFGRSFPSAEPPVFGPEAWANELVPKASIYGGADFLHLPLLLLIRLVNIQVWYRSKLLVLLGIDNSKAKIIQEYEGISWSTLQVCMSMKLREFCGRERGRRGQPKCYSMEIFCSLVLEFFPFPQSSKGATVAEGVPNGPVWWLSPFCHSTVRLLMCVCLHVFL